MEFLRDEIPGSFPGWKKMALAKALRMFWEKEIFFKKKEKKKTRKKEDGGKIASHAGRESAATFPMEAPGKTPAVPPKSRRWPAFLQ